MSTIYAHAKDCICTDCVGPRDEAHAFEPSNILNREHTCRHCGNLAIDEEHDQELLEGQVDEAVDLDSDYDPDEDRSPDSFDPPDRDDRGVW